MNKLPIIKIKFLVLIFTLFFSWLQVNAGDTTVQLNLKDAEVENLLDADFINMLSEAELNQLRNSKFVLQRFIDPEIRRIVASKLAYSKDIYVDEALVLEQHKAKLHELGEIRFCITLLSRLDCIKHRVELEPNAIGPLSFFGVANLPFKGLLAKYFTGGGFGINRRVLFYRDEIDSQEIQAIGDRVLLVGPISLYPGFLNYEYIKERLPDTNLPLPDYLKELSKQRDIVASACAYKIDQRKHELKDMGEFLNHDLKSDFADNLGCSKQALLQIEAQTENLIIQLMPQ